MADTFISVDLGQLTDFSAISVINVEMHLKPYLIRDDTRTERFDPRDSIPIFEVPLIERMQVRYRKVLERVQTIQNNPMLIMRQTEIVLDASGVGQPVLEMAIDMGLEVTPIVITSGNEAHHKDGKYFVPRKEILSSLIVIVQERRMKIAEMGEVTEIAKNELRNLRLKPRAATQTELLEPEHASQHDDVAMSLGMGLWTAMQEHSTEMVYLDRMEDDDYAQRAGAPTYDAANWGLK